MKPNGKTYRLRTIADIWALPDADVMWRALDALANRMLQARRYEEAMARKQKAVPAPASTFTAFDWTDGKADEAACHDNSEDRTLDIFPLSNKEQTCGA